MLLCHAFFLALLAFATPLMAAPEKTVRTDAVRIGVLTDMSGGMAASSGLGSVEAAQLAVEDLGNNVNGRPVVVINADFQNRSDLAQHISESWLSKQGVDAVVDVPNGPIASKLQDYFKEQKKILLTSSPSSTRFRDAACHNNSLAWLYSRDTLTANLIQSLVTESKKQRWFIIKSEDGYSCDLAKIAKKRITDSGAELVGEAQFGKRMSGLSVVLEQAKDVKADVIFLAFDRPDVLHLLNHWPQKHEAAHPVAFTTLSSSDVHELGNKPLPAFYTVSPFYWNQDGPTREWSAKFAARNRGAMPTDTQASVYSSVRHFLQSLKVVQADDTANVLNHMRATPLDDSLFGASRIRRDGLVEHRLLLLSSIKNSERKNPWDIYRIEHIINPQQVLLPPEAICANE